MPPQLILASTSPYRQELLARLGVAFTAVRPRVDEEALKDPRLSPRELAEYLALAKAESLSEVYPHAVIIGSDQVCACGERILGKPDSPTACAQQLALLSGRKHQLFTAVAVWHQQQIKRFVHISSLSMRSLSEAEIEAYIAADSPLGCAGSYKLESQGRGLFSQIETTDETAIIGLPLVELSHLLRELALLPPDASSV